jgi:Tfp pilus assembly protein PilV
MALPNWTVTVFRMPTCPTSAILGIRPARRLGTKPTINRRGPLINRRGTLIVEAVMALVLLTTATVALTKLARSAAALDQQSDQRLTATLAAENTIQRLQGVGVEKLSDQADQVADLVARNAGCEIDISTEPFTTGDRQGIHVRVDATISPAVRISLHDWRFVPEPKVESEDSTGNTAAGGGEDV